MCAAVATEKTAVTYDTNNRETGFIKRTKERIRRLHKTQLMCSGQPTTVPDMREWTWPLAVLRPTTSHNPKQSQIIFNVAKVYTWTLKWDLQDKWFTWRGPHRAPKPCSCSVIYNNPSNDTSHRVNSWASWFPTTSFSFQSLSAVPCVCSVFCGVSPPCPHHLCSIRLIVL